MFIEAMKAFVTAGLLLAGAAGVSRMRRLTMAKVAAGAVLVFAGALGATACNDDDGGGGGSGDELSLEEYFAELKTANDTFTEEGEAATNSLGDTEDVETIKDSLEKLPEVIENFIDDLAELNPPEEAQEAHDEAVETGRVFVDEVKDAIGDLDDVDSLEELGEVVASDSITEANDTFSEACRGLQAIADDNNIEVDLDCEDE